MPFWNFRSRKLYPQLLSLPLQFSHGVHALPFQIFEREFWRNPRPSGGGKQQLVWKRRGLKLAMIFCAPICFLLFMLCLGSSYGVAEI